MLVWGVLVTGKRYKWSECGLTVLITVGCAVFAMGGSIESAVAKSKGAGTYLIGGGLLLGYLASDGWTSTQQERLFTT